MWSFVKRVTSSRIGHLLFAAHPCLVNYYFAQLETTENSFGLEGVITGMYIGGRYMDFDSTLLFVLELLNILPLVLSQGILEIIIFLLPQLSVRTFSWVMAFLLVSLSSLQMLLVGYFIERMVKIYRTSE